MAGKHGGARPGSGPAKKEPPKLSGKGSENPLKFLLEVMNDPEADANIRVRAAVAAAQYVHTKRSHGGKKDEKQAHADKASKGKFAPATAPKLVVNNG